MIYTPMGNIFFSLIFFSDPMMSIPGMMTNLKNISARSLGFNFIEQKIASYGQRARLGGLTHMLLWTGVEKHLNYFQTIMILDSLIIRNGSFLLSENIVEVESGLYFQEEYLNKFWWTSRFISN